MVNQNITQATNTTVLAACIVIATIFTFARCFARWWKIRRFPAETEDLFMLLALASFISMCGIYLGAMPTLYNATAVEAGTMKPYPSLASDLVVMLKLFFVVQTVFFLSLWAVKLSLMFMYRKLTKGIPHFEKIWWAILGFMMITYGGFVVSEFTSCSSLHAWFTAGLCSTPRDATAKAASLWYGLAVDLLTDILIMTVPIRVLLTLQISRTEKIGLILVFAVGIITMIFAIVRVVSLDRSVNDGQVSTTWLIVWGGIEGMVAIIVGCLPSFAIFLRSFLRTGRSENYPTYPIGSHSTHVGNSRQKSRARSESVLLEEVDPIASNR